MRSLRGLNYKYINERLPQEKMQFVTNILNTYFNVVSTWPYVYVHYVYVH